MILVQVLSLFLCIGCYIPTSCGQGVISCGGFIKSDFPIDLKRVMVKLLTSEGNLKYETEVAPNNGYYMIPVYNKGDYIIKVNPPEGWTFEPESEQVSLDGETDACSNGVDVNFNMKGFDVHAKVESGTGGAGPKDLQIDLLDTKTKKVVASTKSLEGGNARFSSVLPGDYELKIGGASGMCVSTEPVPVKVQADVVKLTEPLTILGYKMKGSVQEEGKGLADVSFLLYGPQNVKVSGCSPTPVANFQAPNDLKSDMKYICATKSDEKGNFEFPCVPSEQFSVLPYLELGNVKFTVTPRMTAVKIDHSPAIIKEPFVVKGFSVSGRVTWSKNDAKGVTNAKVVVNDKNVAITDGNGYYTLEEVTSATYSISAVGDNAEFATVKVQLSPKQSKIPDVVAIKLSVCGQVLFSHFPESVPKLTKRTLLLTRKDNAKHTQTIQTDENGKFCKLVEKGRFILEPQILPAEKEAGISVVPQVENINVDSAPVLNVNFKQFQASLTGQIKCLAPCKNVKVSLVSNGKEINSQLLENNQQLQKYEFFDLLPGIYTVQVESDHFCWDHKIQSISVDKSDLTGINFQQKGFRVDVISSNDVKLEWLFSGNKVVHGVETLGKGKNQFCIPVDGTYEFKLVSCHKFEKDVYTYSTKQPEDMNFLAIKHAIKGNVKVKGPARDIKIAIESTLDPNENIEIGPLITQNSADANSVNTLAYEYMALTNDKLIITPSSQLFLYTPSKLEVNIKDDCIVKGLDFQADKGIFLDGKIDPPIEGVEIAMTSADKQLVFNAVSDKNGAYRIGPLRSLDGFGYVAEKQGYTMVHTPGSHGLFKAYKLSELVIKTEDEEGAKLEDVLISVSGGINYRTNNSTAQEAAIVFVGLSPGDYFIKPILKEYSFEPPSQMVSVEEGSTKNVLLVGKRVAYSVFGQVRHLAGQPAVQALVEAVAVDCKEVHEEATTDDAGNFRVRGLIPGCSYQLKLISHPEIETTLPAMYKFTMEKTDLSGRDLIARPTLTNMLVAGRVIAEPEYLPSLKVVVARADEPDASLYTYPMNIGSLFYIPNIPMDKTNYLIRLSTSLPQSQYQNFALHEFHFTANTSFWFTNLEFRPKKKALEADISKASYVFLPLFVALIVMCYNHTKVTPFLQNLLAQAFELVNIRPRAKAAANRESSGHRASPPPEQSADTFLPAGIDPTARKRVKPRKI